MHMVAFYWSAKTVIFVLGAFHARRGETGSELPTPPHTNPGHFPTLMDPTDRKMPRFYVRGVGVLAFSKPPVLPGGLPGAYCTAPDQNPPRPKIARLALPTEVSSQPVTAEVQQTEVSSRWLYK